MSMFLPGYLNDFDDSYAVSTFDEERATLQSLYEPSKIEFEDDIYSYHLLQADDALPSELDNGDTSGSSRYSASPVRDDTPAPEPVSTGTHSAEKGTWLEFRERVNVELPSEDYYTEESTGFESDAPRDETPAPIRLPTLPPMTKKRAYSSRDSDYEESDASDDDDEYDPTFDSNTTSRKRRRSQADVVTKKRKVGTKASTSRAVPSSASRSAHASSSSSSAGPSTSSSSKRRGRPPPGSRNEQTDDPAMVKKLNRLLCTPASMIYDWKCPQCNWEQKNHRMPDFKRHIKTHLKVNFCCEGVPVEKACLYDIPHGAKPYLHQGREMIGGCLQPFSRSDARKRHFNRVDNTCVMYRGD